MKPKPQGLFDLQVNGYAGVDFQDPALTKPQLEFACEALKQAGLSGFLFTLITAPAAQLCRLLESVSNWMEESTIIHDMVAGFHLEGPFISAEDGFRGAHPLCAILDPSPHLLNTFLKVSKGRLKLVTLAPERKNSIEAIRDLSAAGVVVALGHTNASEQNIDDAIGAGATLCTHLGNGVPQMLHRHENIVQRLLARDELTACFIPDGIHVPFSTLKNYIRSKPRGRVLFTTDCMSAAGAPPGQYRLGKLELNVGDDAIVRMPDRTGFAGSALSPRQAYWNICQDLGYSQEAAQEILGVSVRKCLGLPVDCLQGPVNASGV